MNEVAIVRQEKRHRCAVDLKNNGDIDNIERAHPLCALRIIVIMCYDNWFTCSFVPGPSSMIFRHERPQPLVLLVAASDSLVASLPDLIST